MARPAIRQSGHLQALNTNQPTSTKPSKLITVLIPTIASSPTLPTVIRGLLWQQPQPSILIIDTGSKPYEYDELEAQHIGNDNINLVRISPREWPGLSSRVAAAIDLGTAIINTPLCVLTHDDVFLKHRSVLAELQHDHTSTGNIATGYEMSPRTHVTDQWRGMVSHTLTMLDVNGIRRRNLRWSMEDATQHPACEHHGQAWPDTETGFGLAIKEQLLNVTFIGHETNDLHYEDERICHRRSLTSHRFLWPHLAVRDLDWQRQTIERFEQLYNGN